MNDIPWFKVDDHLGTHPKVAKAGNAAMGLWVRAGSWAAAHLTDGYVPTHTLSMLGGSKATAERLVSSGLWDRAKDGYTFRDWFDYQPSADEAEATREKRREAGRKGGIKSGEKRRGA